MMQSGATWPKPSKALASLMAALGGFWLLFAVLLNFSDGLGRDAYGLMIGSGPGVFRGQLWRLVTASMIHQPRHFWGVIVSIMMLYFFGTALSERWGDRRLFVFLFGSGAFAFLIESIAHRLLPSVASAQWFGAMAMADAATVAWALNARGQVVRLYFVIPLKPMTMVWILAGFHVLALITRTPSPAGVFGPFAAMLAGWLFTDGSPLWRAYLQLKLRRIQAEVRGMQRKTRVRGASHLRVVKDEKPSDPHDLH